MPMPRVRFTVRRITVAVAIVAGLTGVAHQVNQYGLRDHRAFLRREWAKADRRERERLDRVRIAAQRHDPAGVVSAQGEAESAANERQNLEMLLHEVQQMLGESPEDAVGPATPKL